MFRSVYLDPKLLQRRRQQQTSDLCYDWTLNAWNDDGVSLVETAVDQDDVYRGSHPRESFNLSREQLLAAFQTVEEGKRWK